MSSTDPWCKLWWSFYSSRSHIGIGPEALAVGPVLMLLAKQSPPTDDGVRWLVMPDGRPVTAADVAHPMQAAKKAVATGIARLVERGTLVQREDGTIGWPGFDRYQRAPSTPRMQKKRERDRHSDASGDEKVTDRGKREEGRGKSYETPPPDPGLLVRTRPAPASSGLFHELDTYRRTLAAELQADLPSWGGSGGQAVDGIGRALDELGGDLSALRDVVRHTAAAVADGSLAPVLFRRMWVGDGFGARLDAWRSSSQPKTERRASAAELAEIAASTANADAFLASMKVESA